MPNNGLQGTQFPAHSKCAHEAGRLLASNHINREKE